MRLGTTVIVRRPMVRGTTYRAMGEIDQSRIDAADASHSRALDYLMETAKDARRDAADRAAEARMERVNVQALEAAQRAADQGYDEASMLAAAGHAGLQRTSATIAVVAIASLAAYALVRFVDRRSSSRSRSLS